MCRHTWAGVRTPQKTIKRSQAFTPHNERPSKRQATGPTPQKQRSSSSFPCKTLTDVPLKSQAPSSSCTAQAMKYLEKHQYLHAFRALIKGSKAARAAMVKAVTEEVRREVAIVTKRASKREQTIACLAGPLTLDALRSFSWSELCEEAEQKMPSLFAVLDAVLPSAGTIGRSIVVGPKGSRR